MSIIQPGMVYNIHQDASCVYDHEQEELWFAPNTDDKSNILITPISKSYKKKSGSCSKRDWGEQEERHKNSLQMMWDDSNKNKSKIGDILAVWKHKEGVSFHNILNIKGTDERLDSWSQNVGHGSRQVLFISPPFSYIKWDIWIKLGGPPRCMGTTRIKSSRDAILKHLTKSG